MNPIMKPFRLVTERVQEVLKVLLTDPDADKMAYFTKILEELKEMAEFYSLAYPEFIETTKKNTVSVRYAQGGDCVHRGIFCPSPVLNMLAGCNQGVEIASPDQATADFYKYRFDAAGRLICVSHYDYTGSRDVPDEVEFILHRPEAEYGITFHSGWNEVTNVAKVVYREGRLENYAMANYDESAPDQMFLHYEEFSYDNDTPVRADVYFGISPELDMFSLDTFHLTYEGTEEATLPGREPADDPAPSAQV